MSDQLPPPTQPTPDQTGEPPRDRDESLTTEGSSPALGTAEATDAAIAALAAARAAALLPPEAPPVVDAASAPAAIVDPTEIDPAEAAPAATEIAATAPLATAPVGTEAVAAPAAPVAATAAATVPPQEAPAAAAGPSRRRMAAARLVRTIGVVVLGVALFVGGVALGTALYQNLRPAPVDSVGVAMGGDDPPPVAQEFISALAANDADALRSSLDQEPHLDLTREMTKFGIQRVDNVEILGTQIDGNRSATEILMQYESTDGSPFAINLVILVDGGKIEGFR
jgi:hypothetical protein